MQRCTDLGTTIDMLKLATILDNPGEPSARTRYRDPKHLRDLGYTGLVLYETTGLSGLKGPHSVGSGEMRRWVGQQFDHVQKRVEEAMAAGLEVYLTYDVLSLACAVVDEHPSRYICKNRPGSICPASEAALDASVDALSHLLGMFPQTSGIVLRFGDNDAGRLPYLVGNDLYTPHCPRCSQVGRADRIVSVLTRFYNVVVKKAHKRLIARAWNLRPKGMHDSVELCQRIADRLPGKEDDDQLVLSFKFTQTDFWRYQPWNAASRVFGKRPILYELQCQREFEGKGGIPAWQVPLWRDGDPAIKDKTQRGGLANIADEINFAGLWAWVRGGGWGGPFVKNELWIDANAYAVPRLADDPKISTAQLAQDWVAQRLKIENPSAARAVEAVLEASVAFSLHGFYIGPYARHKADAWHPNADWIQDDQVDAEAAWRMIQQIPRDQLDAVVTEKQLAVTEVANARAALHAEMASHNRSMLEPLVNTLIYAESFFSALRDLLHGLVAYRQYRRSQSNDDAQTVRHRLLGAQSHWNHHSQRHATLPGAASAFGEDNFWELTQRILSELAE